MKLRMLHAEAKPEHSSQPILSTSIVGYGEHTNTSNKAHAELPLVLDPGRVGAGSKGSRRRSASSQETAEVTRRNKVHVTFRCILLEDQSPSSLPANPRYCMRTPFAHASQGLPAASLDWRSSLGAWRTSGRVRRGLHIRPSKRSQPSEPSGKYSGIE